MSRIRSRDVETQSGNERIIKSGAVVRSKIPPRTVVELQQWPGGPRVGQKELTPGLVQELDGRFTNGETVTLVAAGVTSPGRVAWGAVVRGEGFGVELPDPIAGRSGYYDFHVRVTSNGGTLHGLTISATGSETVSTDPTPFCTEWRGTLAHVLATPGDPLTIDLDWTGDADVDVDLTVGVVEPLATQAATTPASAVVRDVTVTRDAQSFGGHTLTHSAPAGTEVGDLLVVSWCGRSLEGAQGAAGTMTPAAGWTQAAAWTAGAGFSDRRQHYMYVKAADADDAAGSSSYGWSTGGEANYSSLLCVSFIGLGGASLTAAAVDAGPGNLGSLSVTAPAGDFAIVVGQARSYRSTVASATIALNAPTVTEASFQAVQTRGMHRIGVAQGGAAVGATLTGDTSTKVQALFAVGVS